MLLLVLLEVTAKVAIVIVGVQRVIGNRVEFVIAHDRQRRTFVNHRPNDLQYSPLIGTAVDEWLTVAMDIADEVILLEPESLVLLV